MGENMNDIKKCSVCGKEFEVWSDTSYIVAYDMGGVEGENEIILCPECSKIVKLMHHKDFTIGLYATDKPELFKDNKHFDKMFKIEF